jgi:hypothetical protein
MFEWTRGLIKLHERPIGRHYGIYNTVQKKLVMDYWWPMLQIQIVKMCQTFDISQ